MSSDILQDKNDFELITLPALVPVLSTAAGDTLLLLVKHAELIINKVTDSKMRRYKVFASQFQNLLFLFVYNFGALKK